MPRCFVSIVTLLAAACVIPPQRSTGDELGESGFAINGEVKIHYVTAGEGPLVVMLHGFPDYWYTWRKQMPAIARNHQVVAIDLRGFNKSDKPPGVENYTMEKLVGDVKAVVEHFGREKAVVVGHDWGGMIAWAFAMQHPDLTDRLVILNLPHPACLGRELANNPAQQKASAYARRFQLPDAAANLTAEGLASWVKDVAARERYLAAFRRSSFEGMLNYYKANYPRAPYSEPTEFPKVRCPVLMIHGLKDTALLAEGLNGTWNYVADTLTLVTVPDANHFVQQDAADLVTKTITGWLGSTPVSGSAAKKTKTAKLAPETERVLREQLGEAIEAGKIAGGMHLVVKDGEEVFFQAQGVRDIDAQLPMQRDTLARIYSMSKPITSVAAMTLWEQDKFDLDDPVSKFIPAFESASVLEKAGEQWVSVAPKRPITVRDCFRHTTGYGYGGGDNPAFHAHYERERLLYRSPAAMMPPAMTIENAALALARIPAFHHPGERFTYGFSTDLLGRLIEVWSGQSLDAYIQGAVLHPLEMKDTSFSVPQDKVERFACCHTDSEGKLAIVDMAATSPFVDGFEFLSGGGGLVSTIDDYARFCQMLVSDGRFRDRQILKPDTVAMMFSNQLEETPGDFQFGLGFAIARVTLGSGDEARESQQTYWAGYASTDFRLVPAENLFQIFIRQRVPSMHGFARQAFQRVNQGLEYLE